jgi:16S rRNA (uracil1498-N3)-methyltransferase
MTLHQFHVPESLEGVGPGDRLTLRGQEAKHALSVHRLRDGEHARLSDGAGRVAVVRLLGESDRGREPLLVGAVESVEHAADEPLRLHLIQALSKNDRDEAAIETATELGVRTVTPWEAERSIAKWPAAKAKKSAAKWQNVLAAAAKQSRNPWTPVLEPLATTKQLAVRITELTAGGALVVLLHEDATELIGEWGARRGSRFRDAGTTTDVHFIVGPEGGISPRESEMLRDAGAELVGLGPLILRASTAGPVAMAALTGVVGVISQP